VAAVAVQEIDAVRAAFEAKPVALQYAPAVDHVFDRDELVILMPEEAGGRVGDSPFGVQQPERKGGIDL